jgi:hypothetical protein
MNHQQYLQVRAHNATNQPHHHPAENPDDAEHDHMSGHALMASATPYSHVMTRPEVPYDFSAADAQQQKATLSELFRLWGEIKIDCHGEMNPIMAWQWLWHHERRGELLPEDFERLEELLGSKSRCYGYVAMLLYSTFSRPHGDDLFSEH